LLLLEPGAGDELQGLKRGLLEWGDVIAVNKADGERRELAQRTRSEFATALELRRADGPPAPEIHVISARESVGIAELWDSIVARFAALEASGELEARRSSQRKAEFQRRLRSELWRRFSADPKRARDVADLEQRVSAGELLAGDAIARLLGNG
jgi:LAO/AO transport system kinase